MGRQGGTKACVTGATGFVGAHVVRALADRGDDVRVVYRDPNRLKMLGGIPFRRSKGDVLDYKSMCRALRGINVPCPRRRFRGFEPGAARVGAERRGPGGGGRGGRGRRRPPGRPHLDDLRDRDRQQETGRLTSRRATPQDWLGLVYPDSKHAGERVALEATLLAADNGKSGQRYILGGVNLGWVQLIDRVAELSGIRYPILVFR